MSTLPLHPGLRERSYTRANSIHFVCPYLACGSTFSKGSKLSASIASPSASSGEGPGRGPAGQRGIGGVPDLDPFFDATAVAGIYLIARPGPYIKAGFLGPGWALRTPCVAAVQLHRVRGCHQVIHARSQQTYRGGANHKQRPGHYLAV